MRRPRWVSTRTPGASGTGGDPDWTVIGTEGAPAFENSYANTGGEFAPARFRKVGGAVYLDGYIVGGTGVAFTLPEGYRPSHTTYLSCADGGLNIAGWVKVGADGTVTPRATGEGTLISCSFIPA